MNKPHFKQLRFKPFLTSNRSGEKNHIHPEKEFQEILDRERDRADRHNGTFSLVSFNVQNNGNNGVSRELINTIKSRMLRKVDDIGWCCRFHISVMLHNAGTNGARCYVKSVGDLLGNSSNGIEYSVYTYPNNLKSKNGDKNPTNCERRVRSKGTPEDSQKDFSRETFFTKHVEKENHGLAKLFSAEALGVYSCKMSRIKNLFTKKAPAWKRIVDIVGSSLLILVFSPFMIATAAAIKLTSKGPVIFKQQRAGVGGKPFTFYKFRSMVTDAEEKKKELLKYNLRTGPVFKMVNDPRVTLVGNIIRKWSLDEMPQFFNVLKGDMSLVGPRPPTLDEVPKYINWHKRRLDLKPGITCIWQIYARHNKCFENWVRLDIEYARSQSFLLDLKILLLTVPAVISQKGAQ